MTARKPLSILAALGLAASLVLAGCGGSAAPADTAAPETEAVATADAATVSVQVVVEDATGDEATEHQPDEYIRLDRLQQNFDLIRLAILALAE